MKSARGSHGSTVLVCGLAGEERQSAGRGRCGPGSWAALFSDLDLTTKATGEALVEDPYVMEAAAALRSAPRNKMTWCLSCLQTSQAHCFHGLASEDLAVDLGAIGPGIVDRSYVRRASSTVLMARFPASYSARVCRHRCSALRATSWSISPERMRASERKFPWTS